MASTFSFVEYTTSSTSTATPTNLNLGSTCAANLNPSTYPISAGSYSYEKWLKGLFLGTFTSISNIKFWKSTGSLVTGEVINYTGQKTTYVTATNAVSSFATTAIPTSSPSSANVGISGTTTGSLVATGYTDFIVIQASISTLASAGATNSKTFTISYDET